MSPRPRAAFPSLAWQRAAACAGAEAETFFPAPGDSSRSARRVCCSCPVREACLAYALARGERFGVWGGLTPKERAAIPPSERSRIVLAGEPQWASPRQLTPA